jgi:hypothetical protein
MKPLSESTQHNHFLQVSKKHKREAEFHQKTVLSNTVTNTFIH